MRSEGTLGEGLLLWASQRGDVQTVRELLAAGGVDVNVRDDCWSRDVPDRRAEGRLALYEDGEERGETALHRAASTGHWQVVELLLKAGADCGTVDRRGESPLHRASLRADERVVLLLLNAGADRNATTKANLKPLHLCLRHGGRLLNNGTLRTLQALVTFGATWDEKCDELVSTAKALRICVVLWTSEHKRGHPLTQVELEVVKRGPQATKAFLKELRKSSEIHHRRKICVVGPSNAGKTSLIKSIQAMVSSLAHPEDRTIGVDQFKLRFGVTGDDEDQHDIIHEVTFWDFAGQDEYQVAHSLFYSRRTLYLVCVDLEAFVLAYIQADITNDTKAQRERMMNEFIERSVLKWVRAIFARQPDAEFVFVATKEDLLIYPKFTKELRAFLALKLAQVEGIVCEMQREVADQSSPVSKTHRKADTLTLHAYNKRVNEREARDHDPKRTMPSELPRGVVESEAQEAGRGSESKRVRLKLAWSRTCERIVSAVRSRPSLVEEARSGSPSDASKTECVTSGPHAESRVIHARPTLFISCSDANSVARARKAMEVLIHSSERSFQMPESYSSVLNAVVATREAVAKGDASARIEIVFASVEATLASLSSRLKIEHSTVQFVLQVLHDLGDVLWYEDLGVPLFQCTVILDPMLLIDFVRQVITHTHKVDVLSHRELSRLPFWIDLHDEGRMLAMKQMLQKFQLVHPTQGEMTWDADLIVPAFWKCKTPASWLFGYEDLRLVSNLRAHDPHRPKERVRVHWQYMFAHEFPDALFDHVVVASYSPSKHRAAGPDWIVYADDGVYSCRAMVARDVGTKQRVLQLEGVLAEAADATQTTVLWEAFEILTEAIVDVLRRYPGIVFTSTAFDTAGKMVRLEDLFSFRWTIEMVRWMPPTSTWEVYKRCVTDTACA